MSNRHLYIEFLGLPAVGKTTLFNKINFEENWVSKKDFLQATKQRPESSELDNNVFLSEFIKPKITIYL